MTENELELYDYLSHKKKFENKWDTKSCENMYIQHILNHASKNGSGNHGEPDLIYYNENEKLLILLENKPNTNQHESKDKNKPVKYAVDGIKKYLSNFKEKAIDEYSENIKNWKKIGIAFSGDITEEYGYKIDTFYIKENEIIDADIHTFLNEKEYINLFENEKSEEIISEIAKSSKIINQKLRDVDVHNRSILISALMIALLNNDNEFDYKDNKKIVNNLVGVGGDGRIREVLNDKGIDGEKSTILINKLSFLKDDDINNDIIKEILDELKIKVIPLFNEKSNYDIIGKFYSEFLRYAGVTDVKKGIVLTPHHITQLFVDLVYELLDLKPNDVIFDPCCGTGSFLIAGMNKLDDIIESSGFDDKKHREDTLRKKQLIGFEKSSTMYCLAISNMLFRGDGKSKISNIDFFSEDKVKNEGGNEKVLVEKILEEVKPTIGFINPPFGGKDTKDNPTKKEIQFLEKMLDNVSKYGIMIAPISTFFQNNDIRERILKKHRLKYVIHMPKDLFEPNASTHTSIVIFETNNPHNNRDVIFYDLKDDGLVLSKNKGRTDRFNKWNSIKKDLIEKLKNPDNFNDDKNLIKVKINDKNDEWVIYDYIETNYENISDKDFINSIKDYIIFNTKKEHNLLGNENIDEITFLEILNKSYNDKELNFFNLICQEPNNEKIDSSNWKYFYLGGGGK